MRKKFKSSKAKRGIYILPNIFTSLNIFCGFYAVVASIEKNFLSAAIAIIIAGIFDMLDGKIARATNTTSKFGLEYDSLADLVSFGFAPAIMMYLWTLQPLGRLGWLAAFLFVICGALRLARFNTQSGSISSDYFNGLPIPAAAGINAVCVLICARFNVEPNALVILIMLYALSFFMVSTVKFSSFKRHGIFKKIRFHGLVWAVLLLIFIAAEPSIALFILGITYLFSGPFTTWKLKREGKKQALGLEAKEAENPLQ